MKKKIKKQVNKNLKMILAIGIVIVIAMGFLLMLISGNDQERDQVPIDPTAEQQQDDKKDRKERKLVSSTDHPGVSDVAINLYNARVDDIHDTAQVAQLLEASEMRKELGDYLATLQLKDGENTLVISFERVLHAGEDAAFDEAATWYAEQFLALIEDADQVTWKYTIDGEKEKSVKTLTVKQADELLGTELKGYSETPELVQTLLNNQKGIV